MNVQNVDLNGRPTVISLFAGCGGSSLGYKMAGYKELLAIEWDDNAIETFKLNFDSPIEKWDIRELVGQKVLDYCNIKKGELDLLDGSPPCQGFSTAGKRKVSDIRNDLVNHNIRLIDEIQPKVFVIENVSGMVKGKMKGLFIEYMKKMKSMNYVVKCKLLNAMYYQVPQSRQRLIFMGVRKDLDKDPSYPIPSKKIITVKEALKNIQNNILPPLLSNFVKNYVPKMKMGQNLNDVGYKGGFQTKRINSRYPSPTLTKIIGGIGFGHHIHPYEDRVLSISELKRLHTFPDNFKFIGKYQIKSARIGNSVPPLMMKAIALRIKKDILMVEKW